MSSHHTFAMEDAAEIDRLRADAKALRQRLGEIREIAITRHAYSGAVELRNLHDDCMSRIAALAAIQDGEGK